MFVRFCVLYIYANLLKILLAVLCTISLLTQFQIYILHNPYLVVLTPHGPEDSIAVLWIPVRAQLGTTRLLKSYSGCDLHTRQALFMNHIILIFACVTAWLGRTARGLDMPSAPSQPRRVDTCSGVYTGGGPDRRFQTASLGAGPRSESWLLYLGCLVRDIWPLVAACPLKRGCDYWTCT